MVATAVKGQPLEWVTLQGRLPETGVRVQLTWIRRRDLTPLLGVPA